MVDIARPASVLRRKKIRRATIGAVAVLVVILVTIALAQLKPAAPTVDLGTILTDTVKRGDMLRNVRGLGTLVPEDIRWIPATTDGRVERIVVRPGTSVTPDTVLIELSNPRVEQEARDAEFALRAAEAELASLRVQLNNQLLAQRAAAATVQADFTQAKLAAEANQRLGKEGLVSELILKQSIARAEELATRQELERKRLASSEGSLETQLSALKAVVEQRRALSELRRSQASALRVRAGVAGMLTELPLQVGQQVQPGTNLARVADPTRLRADLRVAETQAKDLAIGQKAVIDTRNGIVPGRVVRIDPAAQAGTVGVDVALEGELPRGARADLNVDGTIELEHLRNILNVGRPAFGQEHSTVTLFKLEPDGTHAVATRVKLGRQSVQTIEIVEGLKEGDRIILSDTSAYEVDRIRLR
jgi:HlyD family secretion protein